MCFLWSEASSPESPAAKCSTIFLCFFFIVATLEAVIVDDDFLITHLINSESKFFKREDQPGNCSRLRLQDSPELGRTLSVRHDVSQEKSDQRSTNLHGNGLHIVADEVAQLFVAAIAAILLAVAHLGVVDARRVAAPPVQLRVAVGASTLGLKERINQNNFVNFLPHM